ncbi:MAG: VOC family protein [Acidobacteriales bacterium]|nr:VOC family protein [Terriglobales bacterium]
MRQDVLGFRLKSRDYVARFDVNGVLFELVPNPPGHEIGGFGNARLSLGVEDIQQAKRSLEARGVKASDPKEEPGGLISFFKDPDGNELCLWQSTGA